MNFYMYRCIDCVILIEFLKEILQRFIFASSKSFSVFIFFLHLYSLHGIRAKGRYKALAMANASSENAKNESSKGIVTSTLIAPHSVGFHIPIKLTRDKFLLWKTQIFPWLNYHNLAHILMQHPPISTQLDDHGGITVNPTYQAWWHQDQHVLSLIVTSLSESMLS